MSSELATDETDDKPAPTAKRWVRDKSLPRLYRYGRKGIAFVVSLMLLCVAGFNILTLPLDTSTDPNKKRPAAMLQYEKAVMNEGVDDVKITKVVQANDRTIDALRKLHERLDYESLSESAQSVQPPFQSMKTVEAGPLVMQEYSGIGNLHLKLARRYAKNDRPGQAFRAYEHQRTLTRPYRTTDDAIEGEIKEVGAESVLIKTAHAALKADLDPDQRRLILQDMRMLSRVQNSDYEVFAHLHSQLAGRYEDHLRSSDRKGLMHHTFDTVRSLWPFYSEFGSAGVLNEYERSYRRLKDQPVASWPTRFLHPDPDDISALRTGMVGDDRIVLYVEALRNKIINLKDNQAMARCVLSSHTDNQHTNAINGEPLNSSCGEVLTDSDRLFRDDVENDL